MTTMPKPWEQRLTALTDAIEDLGFAVGVTVIDRDDGLGPLIINVVTGLTEDLVKEAAIDVALKLGFNPGEYLDGTGPRGME